MTVAWTAGLSASWRNRVTVSTRRRANSASGNTGRLRTSATMASTSAKSSARQVHATVMVWRVVPALSETPRSSSSSAMTSAERRSVPRSMTRPVR